MTKHPTIPFCNIYFKIVKCTGTGKHCYNGDVCEHYHVHKENLMCGRDKYIFCPTAQKYVTCKSVKEGD